MKMCFNWKILAALGVVGLGIYIAYPSLIASALPLLLVAACPLSMLLMGGMMGQMGKGQGMPQGQQLSQPGEAGQYTCPMHPEIQSTQPGRCPTCGMNLVDPSPLRQEQALPATGRGAALTREEQLAQLQTQLQSVSEQQTALARQVEQLQEAGEPMSGRALEEAEQVARAAERRQ